MYLKITTGINFHARLETKPRWRIHKYDFSKAKKGLPFPAPLYHLGPHLFRDSALSLQSSAFAADREYFTVEAGHLRTGSLKVPYKHYVDWTKARMEKFSKVGKNASMGLGGFWPSKIAISPFTNYNIQYFSHSHSAQDTLQVQCI